MSEISTTRSGNVLVPYVDAKKRTKQVDISSYVTGAAISFANAVAYADSTGKWRMVFNLLATQSPASSMSLVVAGISITNNAALSVYSGVSAWGQSVSTNALYVKSGQIFTTATISGELELSSKPTWADAHMEDVAAVDVFIAENSLPGSKMLDNSIPVSKLVGSGSGPAKTLLATDKFTANNSGAQSSAVSVYYMSVGDQVTVYIPAFTLSANSSDVTLTFASTLPVGYRPLGDLIFSIAIRSAANDYTMGNCRIYTDGTIKINHDNGGNQFGAGTAGVQVASCVTFIVA